MIAQLKEDKTVEGQGVEWMVCKGNGEGGQQRNISMHGRVLAQL